MGITRTVHHIDLLHELAVEVLTGSLPVRLDTLTDLSLTLLNSLLKVDVFRRSKLLLPSFKFEKFGVITTTGSDRLVNDSVLLLINVSVDRLTLLFSRE